MDESTAVQVVLGLIFAWVAKAVVKYLNINLTKSQEQSLEWAAKQAALATEQVFRHFLSDKPKEQLNAEKLKHAVKTAKSLAPKATKNLTDADVELVVEAQVAALKRSSVPEYVSIPAPDGTVTYARSILPPRFPPSEATQPPTPIPAPSRVPVLDLRTGEATVGEDPPTKPEKGLRR